MTTMEFSNQYHAEAPARSDTDLAGEGEPSMAYNAELRGSTTFDTGWSVIAVGRIFGDRKCRWPDGRMIQTSALQAPSEAMEGRVVATLNLHYLLVGPKRLFLEVAAEMERERTK